MNNFQFNDVQVDQQVVDVSSGEAVNRVQVRASSFRGSVEEARAFLADLQAAVDLADSLLNNQ